MGDVEVKASSGNSQIGAQAIELRRLDNHPKRNAVFV